MQGGQRSQALRSAGDFVAGGRQVITAFAASAASAAAAAATAIDY